MKIEVRTTNHVRIMLEMSSVKSQRMIINGDHSHCQVTLVNGKTIDLKTPIFDFPLEPDIDISKKNKFLNRLTNRMTGESGNGSSL